MIKITYKNQLVGCCLVFILTVLLAGCLTGGKSKSGIILPPIQADRIAFLGFKPAILEGQKPGLFQNPISGTTFNAQPVSQATTDKLSDELYTFLIESKDPEFINLRDVKKLTDPALFKEGSNEIKIIQDIGNAISADAAIAGYIYRIRERVGSEYSAQSPASVAFDVYLISMKNGSLLWKSSFDKTQKTLSENLLELKSFLSYKGKWVDADKLAEIGLKELVDRMPLKNKQ